MHNSCAPKNICNVLYQIGKQLLDYRTCQRQVLAYILALFCLIIGTFLLTIHSAYATTNNVAAHLMLMNNYNSQAPTSLWQRMRLNFGLDHSQSNAVRYYERYYSKNSKQFYRLINSALPYLYYLLSQCERYGIPSEVAFIPAIESRFDPFAKNPLDAYAGLWQFEPLAASRFNLQHNEEIEDRRNIIKSTQAALVYLLYLERLFKQWDIAIGAYNWGEGGMYKAILASGATIGHVNYNDLKLRPITANYVPKLIAITNIIANPEHFGLRLPEALNQPYFMITSGTVNTAMSNDNNDTKQLALKEFMRQLPIDATIFRHLNPQFKSLDYNINAFTRLLIPIDSQNALPAIYQNDNNSEDAIALVADNATLSDNDITTISYANEDNPDNTNSTSALTANTALTSSNTTKHTTAVAHGEDNLDQLIHHLDRGQ